jgi:hypothetical protein
VRRQWSPRSRTFTSPKNGSARWAIIAPPARDALLRLARESEWCFTTLRGTHFTPSARSYHWKAIQAAAGYDDTLYLATRHYFGWYAINVLGGLSSEDVAVALGHTCGGELVRRLYGHLEQDKALARVSAAFASTGSVTPLKIVRRDVG